MKTRVLVVDDSPLIRQILTDLVASEPDLEVIGQCRDGAEAVVRIDELKPDVVTMDVEMPNMNGLDALEQVMAKHRVPVIMVSTRTSAGAQTTLRALELGAFDFVCKPKNGAISAIREVKAELLGKIRAAKGAKVGAMAKASRPAMALPRSTDKILLIASSTGGPKALATFFESLPVGFPAPILMVQHMPVGFTASLAQRLNGMGRVAVREARSGDKPEPGLALLAPGGLHLTFRPNGTLELTDDPPMHGVKPAADLLFLSAAKLFGSRLVATVLTGMGRDGAEGALAVRKAGGTVLAESEETCTVYGMPRAAVELGAVHGVHRIEALPGEVGKLIAGRMANAS
jgi:two-component system chemotaxis response regulator CheB